MEILSAVTDKASGQMIFPEIQTSSRGNQILKHWGSERELAGLADYKVAPNETPRMSRPVMRQMAGNASLVVCRHKIPFCLSW